MGSRWALTRQTSPRLTTRETLRFRERCIVQLSTPLSPCCPGGVARRGEVPLCARQMLDEEALVVLGELAGTSKVRWREGGSDAIEDGVRCVDETEALAGGWGGRRGCWGGQ